MDSRTFLGLEPTHNRFRWKMPVERKVATAGDFLFGGCGLGAAVSAIEGTAERQCVWATAQYLSYAPTGSVLDIDVTLAVEGRNTTQARAVCHVDDREILTVNASLGDRSIVESGQFEHMPDDLPEPESLAPRPVDPEHADTITGRFDQRMVQGVEWSELSTESGAGQLRADGRTIMWARIPDVITEVDTTALAILGDFVPMGVGQALGRRGGGNSLDNTLRVYRTVPTEWVLMDIRIHGVERGFGHGLVHMFAEDGTLLATASQSVIVRFWRPDD